jgi:hypothetical protein
MSADIDTHSDTEIEASDKYLNGTASQKRNTKGLLCLSNGVVSMCDLKLAFQVPTKTRNEDVVKLFSSCLTLSNAFTMFTLVVPGKCMPIEKTRDESYRLILLQSGTQYCLNSETLATILEADSEERNAYLIGLAKSAQQSLHYTLH